MLPVALAFCAGAAALLALPALLPVVTLAVPALAIALTIRRRPAIAAFAVGFVWTHWLASHSLATG
ncbi:MAG: hypothetical protein ACRES3_08530, partial [Steroidobacteraceae bacterium]